MIEPKYRKMNLISISVEHTECGGQEGFKAFFPIEFLDLGQHCSEKTCKRLDFLPLKCDACGEVFCKDHISYIWHECASAYKKDVPVCPLCHTPIPVKKGEMTDAAVGAHMDRDCKRDSAHQKQKIFSNKCFKPGCKVREMMKLVCDQYHRNFCVRHQHPWITPAKEKAAPFPKMDTLL